MIKMTLVEIKWKPHPGQKEVHLSKARFKVLSCGRRWGKTLFAFMQLLIKALENPGIYWWVAPIYKELMPVSHIAKEWLPKGLINNKDFRKILSHLPGPSPENSLLTKFPQISKEWNFDRNSPLLPIQFSPQSNKRMWWRCEKSHEWQALI